MDTEVGKTKKFARNIFGFGVAFGFTAFALYSVFVTLYGTWDATALFQAALILWGLGFMFPCFSVSLKLMFQSYDMSYRALVNSEKIGLSIGETADKIAPIIEKVDSVSDKVEPIINSIQEVSKKAGGVSEDVERITHRVREVIDSMNGSLNFESIKKEMISVRNSLETLADVFQKPGNKEDGELEASFPLPIGSRKNRRRR